MVLQCQTIAQISNAEHHLLSCSVIRLERRLESLSESPSNTERDEYRALLREFQPILRGLCESARMISDCFGSAWFSAGQALCRLQKAYKLTDRVQSGDFDDDGEDQYAAEGESDVDMETPAHIAVIEECGNLKTIHEQIAKEYKFARDRLKESEEQRKRAESSADSGHKLLQEAVQVQEKLTQHNCYILPPGWPMKPNPPPSPTPAAYPA